MEAIEALLAPRIALTGGGHMMIEPTRALVAVDVNTGPDTSPAASLKANIAAARDLPRQLRLRGLGGQVVVDFGGVVLQACRFILFLSLPKARDCYCVCC